MNAITYQKLSKDYLHSDILDNFNRYELVNRCWRKENDKWFLIDNRYVEDWDLNKKRNIVAELSNCISNNGLVYGAILDNKIIGFASMSTDFFGKKADYVELLLIQVTTDYRNNGIGKNLFRQIVVSAKQIGAKKIYISANSSEQSQAFYKSCGCTDALEINQAIAKNEPFDRQMEYLL